MTKFYIDASGNYIGGFCGAEPPAGAIEVDSPPEHGWQKYINGAWLPLTDEQLQQLGAK